MAVDPKTGRWVQYGSAVCLQADPTIIVMCEHQIENRNGVLYGGKIWELETTFKDYKKDIAVLVRPEGREQIEGVRPLTIGKPTAKVAVYGYGGGRFRLTNGDFASGATITNSNIIPGDSGGAVVNDRGEVFAIALGHITENRSLGTIRPLDEISETLAGCQGWRRPRLQPIPIGPLQPVPAPEQQAPVPTPIPQGPHTHPDIMSKLNSLDVAIRAFDAKIDAISKRTDIRINQVEQRIQPTWDPSPILSRLQEVETRLDNSGMNLQVYGPGGNLDDQLWVPLNGNIPLERYRVSKEN